MKKFLSVVLLFVFVISVTAVYPSTTSAEARCISGASICREAECLSGDSECIDADSRCINDSICAVKELPNVNSKDMSFCQRCSYQLKNLCLVLKRLCMKIFGYELDDQEVVEEVINSDVLEENDIEDSSLPEESACENGCELPDCEPCPKENEDTLANDSNTNNSRPNESNSHSSPSYESNSNYSDITNSSNSSQSSRPSEDSSVSNNASNNTSSELKSYAQDVVNLVNKERTSRGLSALNVDVNVQRAAQVRAEEQKTLFSHTRPNGTSCFTVLNESGVSYRGAGENIAMGQTTPTQVMNGWMNSKGHRENILNPNFNNIGVGVYKDSNGRYYWTQMFTY